jgi:hypothetical protein
MTKLRIIKRNDPPRIEVSDDRTVTVFRRSEQTILNVINYKYAPYILTNDAGSQLTNDALEPIVL